MSDNSKKMANDEIVYCTLGAVWGPEKNPGFNNGGFILQWGAKSRGFGELSFVIDNENNLICDTELETEEFAVECFRALLKSAKIKEVRNPEVVEKHGLRERGFDILERFDNLVALKNGWFDGEGLAPNKESLNKVIEIFLHNYPNDIVLPMVTPVPNGNIFFEWDLRGSPSVELDLNSMIGKYHAISLDDTSVEWEIKLDTAPKWKILFSLIGWGNKYERI